jgi:hypothetical protein
VDQVKIDKIDKQTIVAATAGAIAGLIAGALGSILWKLILFIMIVAAVGAGIYLLWPQSH